MENGSHYKQYKDNYEAYRKKIRRFTLQFSLHDTDARAWFEQQPEPGTYLKNLILADKERQMAEPQEHTESPSQIRMAGDYEIIHALHIGPSEIVIGENPAASEGEKYLCAFCVSNDLFTRYEECIVSDNYTEIVKNFGERVMLQAEKTRQELARPRFQGIKDVPITAKDCTPLSGEENLEGKVVVIKQDVLRREYRVATHQLKLCRGGSGARPNSRGSACFCIDLYSGKESRFERWDILGTMEPEQLPKWAKYGLESIRQTERKEHEKEDR